MKQNLETECLSDPARLEDLRDDWFGLWLKIPESTLFQSPDWLIPWTKAYARDCRVLVLTFRQNGELVGLAPFYVFQKDERSRRQLFLLGIGNSDYLDILVRPGWETEIRNRVFRELDQWIDHWDEVHFEQLLSSSPLLTGNETPSVPCLVLDLDGPNRVDHWMAKSDIYEKRLKSHFSYLSEEASEDSVDEFIISLEQLHRKRWQAKGLPGVLTREDMSFHREAARRLCIAGTWSFAVCGSTETCRPSIMVSFTGKRVIFI